jgi:hypothetical protein
MDPHQLSVASALAHNKFLKFLLGNDDVTSGARLVVLRPPSSVASKTCPPFHIDYSINKICRIYFSL